MKQTEKTLWEYELAKEGQSVSTILHVVLSTVALGLYLLFLVNVFAGIAKWHWSELLTPFFLAVVGIYHFLRWTTAALKATTTKYQVYEDRIVITDWILKRREVCILLSDVQRFSLVQYDNTPFSTIFIDTLSDQKYKGTNLKNGERRSKPTLENVKDGENVFQLLESLRRKAFMPVAGSIPVSLKQPWKYAPRLLTLSMGLLYMGLLFCSLLYEVDRLVLTDQWHEEKIISTTHFYDIEGTSYGAEHETVSGYTIRLYQEYPVGTSVKFATSPIFTKVTKLQINGDRRDSERMSNQNGYGPLIEFLVIGMLMFCSWYIIRSRGFIEVDEALFVLGGPLLFLVLSLYTVF